MKTRVHSQFGKGRNVIIHWIGEKKISDKFDPVRASY